MGHRTEGANRALYFREIASTASRLCEICLSPSAEENDAYMAKQHLGHSARATLGILDFERKSALAARQSSCSSSLLKAKYPSQMATPSLHHASSTLVIELDFQEAVLEVYDAAKDPKNLERTVAQILVKMNVMFRPHSRTTPLWSLTVVALQVSDSGRRGRNYSLSAVAHRFDIFHLDLRALSRI